jgi:uncharacterized protein YfaS (alpha-2-macroglobulin family)
MLKRILRLELCLILAAGLLLTLANCRRQAQTGQEGAPLPKAIVGDLHLLHVSPQGATTSARMAEQLTAIFDHPMVPLQEVPEGQGSSFLKVEPSVPGRFRWLGTRTLTFTPSDRFPYATEVRVTIPAGTTSLDGYNLKQDYAWTFSTITPKVVGHIPSDGEKWVRLDQRIRVVFNQPVDESKARPFLTLTALAPDGKHETVDYALGRLSAQEVKEEKLESRADDILVLRPRDELKPDFAYSLSIAAGLPGREGPLGMPQESGFEFETFKSFKFLGVDPKDNLDPYDALKVQFSNQVSYKELAAKVRFTPELKIPDYYSEWDSSSDLIWLNLPFQPETAYTLTIPGDIHDEFGNTLGREVTVRFTTASYPPSIRMTTGHGVIEAYAKSLYSFQATNIEEAFFQGGRVSRDRVVPLLTAEKTFWSSEDTVPFRGFYNVEKKLHFKVTRNKRQLVPLDLREVLGGEHGLVFIQLQNPAAESWDRYLKAFLQVTELGLTGKFSAEDDVIWVTELRTGDPVPGAEVEIRDSANRVCWRGRTGADGRVTSPGWKALGIRSEESWQKPEQYVFASRGDDLAFISSSWGTGIEPYRFGIDYDWESEPESQRGYLFTERGIYRAGETVHVKGILRRQVKGQWALPSVDKVACQVNDSMGKSVYNAWAAVDDFGGFSFDLNTLESASLGTYRAWVRVPAEGGGWALTFSNSFRVEAFRPAEFEVHLRSLQDSYVFGEDYRAKVRASYLFGGAMAGQKVNWSLRLNPAAFTPPGFKGFIFGNELDWDEPDLEEGRETSRLIGSGETVLNGQGRLEVSAPLVPEKEKDSVMAALEATVQSPSRRSISNRIQTVVHRGEYYLGLKPESSFLTKGQKLKVEVVAARPDGAALERKVNLKLFRREWRSVRKAGSGGRFEWLTEKTDTEVGSEKVTTRKEPVNVAFSPDKSGFYILRAEATDARRNRITTSTYVYITGDDYVAWERRDDDMIELVPDAETYRPGDKARILVKCPYERAKALVTVERESILESRVLEIQGSTARIEVPIVSDYIPNVFVSVLLVQGRTENVQPGSADDAGKPSFKIGYAKLAVDPQERKLKVDLRPDQDRYKPGQQVSLKLHVADQEDRGRRSSLAVAVVDVGVLNLIGYTTPDPFSRFFGPKPLSVDTSDTRINIVGQRTFGEKGENAGGGGEEAESAGLSLSEVELRGNFKTTAYWNPSLVTDDQGEASITFTLPDNLTTFRVMAVALTRDSLFGNGETSFRVAKPLLLQASLPRFARVGDSFQAGVVVHNFAAQKGRVELAGEFQGLTLLDKDARQSFELEPGASREILFSVKAESPGQATFSFRAVMGADSDGLQISLPVELPRPTETVALFGETTQSAEEQIVIPGLYPDQSRLELQASATALSGLKECLAYLTDYPFLCLEQRLSAILPYVLAPEVIRDFQLSRMQPKEWRAFVQKTIDRLFEYQKDSGGFGLWPDSPYESPYLTCYAVFGLEKARRGGYAVKADSLSRALAYLQAFLRQKNPEQRYPYSPQDLRTTWAFALYDLALTGRPEPAYNSRLFAERDKLTVFGRALLLKALHLAQGSPEDERTLVQELINSVKVTTAQAHFEEDRTDGWIYSSNLRTTAYILQSLLEVGSDDPVLPGVARWIVERRKAGRWTSTQENLYAFYALNTFYLTHEKVRPNFKVEMSLARKLVLREEFRGPTAEIKTATASLAGYKAGQTVPLKIVEKGEGRLYYGARMTYVARHPLDPRDEGLAVFKKYETLDGQPLESIRAGDVVAVTLEIAVPQESLFVAVEDPLPAGLEAVNTTLQTESTELGRILGESQPSRPWWSSGFNHLEMHDNRVLLFADRLTAGVHTYRYLARALTFGEFVLPGTKVEQMYAPEVFGRSAEKTIRIVK